MTTILHLSDLYGDEGWNVACARELDLRGIEQTSRYCSPEAGARLCEALEGLDEGGLRWIDTGDFHYISELLMQRVSEPFVLALYDNHSDDIPGAFDEGLLSCGNWVKAARESLTMMKADFFNSPLLPEGLPVYLSIDLDVLSTDFARTGWSQGGMSLPSLVQDLARIRSERRIIGVDICGGLTASQGARAADFAVNLRTRRVLQELLGDI